LPSKHYGTDLSVFIFQCKVKMPGDRNAEVGNFTGNPDKWKVIFNQRFDFRRELGNRIYVGLNGIVGVLQNI